MVEHQREKQYMKSMLDDSKRDTAAEIIAVVSSIDRYLNDPVLKKSIVLLYLDHFSDSTIKELITVPKSTWFFTITFQNNTVTQLKNSGNLRLIRNKEITDSLAKYWNECEYLINTQLASYETTRIRSKELVFSLFNFNYFENNSLTNPFRRKNISLKLMSDDRIQFIKLGNYLSNSHTQLTGSIFQRLKNINQKATDLITLIQVNITSKQLPSARVLPHNEYNINE